MAWSLSKTGKTVHNHYDDIFAYWDAPFSITNGYTEGLNGLIKMSNRLGRGYSYEIIRAKTLYSKKKPARLAVVFEQDEARSSMDRTFRHC